MLVQQTNDANFEVDVLQSPMPVLVDFWAEWCGPCKMLSPILEDAYPSISGKTKILKLNIDENPNTPAQYGVRSIPTMIIFIGGKAVATKVGLLTKSNLIAWVESIVG
ncbi:MAG: thioredoxin [Alphaproteobacteria bacterium]|nr:thioredoxin [Alphaproteobacteria bacterium]